MKIGILGSGAVGKALALGFLDQGHQVWLATRDPQGNKGRELGTEVSGVTVCDFATAAREAELAVLCVNSAGIEGAIRLIDPENLAGKVVIDTTNVIKQEGQVMVYGGGLTSAAEQVQEQLHSSIVVKAFNTVGAALMYKPQLSGTPTMFIAGNDMGAKQQVSQIATAFGWEPLDAGPLVTSRELEAMALVWIRNTMSNGSNHAFKML